MDRIVCGFNNRVAFLINCVANILSPEQHCVSSLLRDSSLFAISLTPQETSDCFEVTPYELLLRSTIMDVVSWAELQCWY